MTIRIQSFFWDALAIASGMALGAIGYVYILVFY